jgi:hypothetical protein
MTSMLDALKKIAANSSGGEEPETSSTDVVAPALRSDPEDCDSGGGDTDGQTEARLAGDAHCAAPNDVEPSDVVGDQIVSDELERASENVSDARYKSMLTETPVVDVTNVDVTNIDALDVDVLDVDALDVDVTNNDPIGSQADSRAERCAIEFVDGPVADEALERSAADMERNLEAAEQALHTVTESIAPSRSTVDDDQSDAVRSFAERLVEIDAEGTIRASVPYEDSGPTESPVIAMPNPRGEAEPAAGAAATHPSTERDSPSLDLESIETNDEATDVTVDESELDAANEDSLVSETASTGQTIRERSADARAPSNQTADIVGVSIAPVIEKPIVPRKSKNNRKPTPFESEIRKLIFDPTVGTQIAEMFERIDADCPSPGSFVLLSTQVESHVAEMVGCMALVHALGNKKNVLVVDANPEQSLLSQGFSLDGAPGLSDACAGRSHWKSVVQPTATARLSILPAGNSLHERSNHSSVDSIVREMTDEYDMVMVDGGKIIEEFALPLCRATDRCYLLVRLGKTPRELVKTAVEMLRGHAIEIHGTIVTNVPTSQ